MNKDNGLDIDPLWFSVLYSATVYFCLITMNQLFCFHLGVFYMSGVHAWFVFRCCEVLSTLFLFSINNLSLLCFHRTTDLMKARVVLAETLLFQISVGEKEEMC